MYSSSIVSLTTDPAYIIIFDQKHYPWANLQTEEGQFEYNMEQRHWAGEERPPHGDFFEEIILGEAEDLARR